MGFDNECILNIQSLAGEYFCPVCRLLVYPSEAIQAQCTHLYCKPCLIYTANTTKACPYDGYLVTEADSKPLMESNKLLADTIGKIEVHCLYHRSGCTWQGPLSECNSHCSGCAFGNSAVVCNRCGIQIVHRQVQEHAQTCSGVQTQATQVEGSQNAAATGGQIQTSTPIGADTSQATTAPGHNPNQQASSNPQPAAVSAAVPTADQWYHQQQQYYQQYPGYGSYQQPYQQYPGYQQQALPQYQQQQQQYFQAHHQSQAYMQPQSQLPQSQPQGQLQSHSVQVAGQQLAHPSLQAPATNQAPATLQPHAQPATIPNAQVPPQAHLLSQGQTYVQQHSSSQAFGNPPHLQQAQMPQYAQPPAQMHQYPQPPAQMPQYQKPLQLQRPQTQVQTQAYSQPQPQTNSIHHNQPLNPNVQHTSAQAVTGHQSYPPSQAQQQQLGASQLSHVRPPPPPPHPQSHSTMLNQQQAAFPPSAGQLPYAPPTQQQPLYSHAPQQGFPIHQQPAMQHAHQSMAQQFQQQQPYHMYEHGHIVQQQQDHQDPHQSSQYQQSQHDAPLPHNIQHHQSHNLTGLTQTSQHSGAGQQARQQQFGVNQPSESQTGAQSGVVSKEKAEKPGDGIVEAGSGKKETTGADAGTEGVEQRGLNSENECKDAFESTCSSIDNCPREITESKRVYGTDSGSIKEEEEPVSKRMVKEEAPDNTEQSAQGLEKQSGKMLQDENCTQLQGTSQGPGIQRPYQEQIEGVFTNNELNQYPQDYGPSTFQQRPPMPSVLQAPPGPPSLFRHQAPGHVTQSEQRQISSHGPDSVLAFERGLDQYGAPPNGHFSADALKLSPNIHARMIGGAPPHGSVERGPHGQPLGIHSSAFGVRDERYRPLRDEHLNRRYMDPARQGEFEEDLRRFPRPYMDPEQVSEFGTYQSLSKSFDRGLHGFGMDVPRLPNGNHAPNFDTGSMAGGVSTRVLPPYGGPGEGPLGRYRDGKGRPETAHSHPDFLGPATGLGRRHMDDPRSPRREYPSLHRYGALNAGNFGLDDINDREAHRFGYSNRYYRGDFEGAGHFRGNWSLPDPCGVPGHLRLGEPVGFGGYPGHARMDEVRPRIFHQPRLGDPGFRSSFSHQGFPTAGDYPKSLGISKKRRRSNLGWCRLCKVDCDTTEGLDMHSQTRDHQKVAMKIVVAIKQNASNNKLSSSGRVSVNDASKLKNASSEGHDTKN